MLPAIAFAILGMVVVTVGSWRMTVATGAARIMALAVTLCGLVVIWAGVRLYASAFLGMLAVGVYGGTGGMMGGVVGLFVPSLRGGAVLAQLGGFATSGFKSTSVVAFSLIVIGQILFFTTMAVNAFWMWRSRWILAQRGILWPHQFLPWAEIASWEWRDSTTLAIGIKPGFSRRANPILVPVPIDIHDRAEAVLASKIPPANAGPLQ